MIRAAFRDTFVTVTVPGHVSMALCSLQGFSRRRTTPSRFRHSFVTVTVPGHGPAGQWPERTT